MILLEMIKEIVIYRQLYLSYFTGEKTEQDGDTLGWEEVRAAHFFSPVK